MWIELPASWIIGINCLGIPTVHFLVSWGVTFLPRSLFEGSRAPVSSGCREWEQRFHERVLLVRRWKRHLPDAAPWFEGFAKGSLVSTSPGYLCDFVAETRRGEFAHWIQWAMISGFVTWNPYPANVVIVGYAMLSNMPCIVSLRHTRLRLARLRNRLVRIPG